MREQVPQPRAPGGHHGARDGARVGPFEVEGGGQQHAAPGVFRGEQQPAPTTKSSFLANSSVDPRIHALGRVQVHPRVLHPQPVDHHRAAAGLCAPPRRAVHDAAAADQGRGACGQGRE